MNFKTHTMTTLTATSFLTLYTPIEPSIGIFLGAALGGLSPDIDEPQSYIGRKTSVKIGNKRYGPSAMVKSIFGHRGITHSILAMVIAFIPYFLCKDFYAESDSLFHLLLLQFLLGFGIGYVCHILGDFITVQGVPLFLPFTKYKFKIPLFKVNSPVEYFIFFLSALALIYSIFLHFTNFLS